MKNERFIQAAGILCILAGLVGCVLGIIATANPSTTLPTSQGFGITQVTLAFSDSAFLLSVVALALSGLAGESGLAKTGLFIAITGRVVSIIGEITLVIQYDLGKILLTTVTMVIALGMLLTGIAVSRAARWQGWGKFTPLFCGLYIFLVLLPAFGASGGPNFLALGGMGLVWSAYGVALIRSNSGTQLVPTQTSAVSYK